MAATGGTISETQGDDMATYTGTSAANTITGSTSADTIYGRGGNDTLYGRGGNDTLHGQGGNDALYGEDGNDKLLGGIGVDSLAGGAGADLFVFKGAVAGLSAPSMPDTIADFSRTQGDKISFTGLALTGAGAPATLTWAGTAAKAWGVWQEGGTVKADTSGDAVADLAIAVQNAPALAATDFQGVSAGSTTGPGFRVVLSDNFGAGYQTSNWGNPYGGSTYWNGAFSWSGADVAVRNGEMQVTMTRHADGSWTAGGFNSFKAGKSIRYGTVEFDARVEEAQGTMAAILMWPAADIWPPEIDILETPGQDVMHTLHWAGAGGSDQYSSVRNQAYDETAWHHYKMTWLPNDLKIEVDGVVRARWTQNVPDIAMGFGAQGFVGSPDDAWMGGAPSSGTPSVVTVHLDNVVMSQWEGAVA